MLQGLQRTSSALAWCCRSLERATSHPVQANAYLTPAGAAGLKRHHDDHDVLVLQVFGTKAWDIETLGPAVTRPGDALYMPAGTPHEAMAQDGASLHLTIGLLRVTDLMVAERVLGGVATLDRPLPLGYARPERAEALRAHLEGTVAMIGDSLASADLDVLAEAEVTRARKWRLPLPAGQIHLPVGARPAVEQLLREPSVRVGDLEDLEPNGQLVLARRLVREGLLVVAT